MDSTKKFICIHGHFYQPPRENAWLDVVEAQDSAAPFHDWNERINFECYAPNTAARILDERRFITKIINNYTRISFNFGPTLMSWLERADPETYESILHADQIGRERFGGHGPALAQAHSHLILPLANDRDKETQVIWGIRDFEHHFGRKPEGMWLAETAADTQTLEALAAQGIKFTILAPRQAKAFRKIGAVEWTDLPGENIDTRRPYLFQLPSGKLITLFFYHGDIAQGVAFNGLLNNGPHFAQSLISAFDPDDRPQLVHIATDGESYGHHHRHGEMALAHCLDSIENDSAVQLTTYGAYLEQFPPEYEVRIHENSSWSCVHGVERWRSDCGCNTGGRPGWTQAWRAPLRETLDRLRDQLIPIYEKEASLLLHDVWEARNDYIHVALNRTEKSVAEFVKRHARMPLDKEQCTKLLRLMEMQRNAMLMFTSCGWFFDEISGIETNQILQYANRAIYYSHQLTGKDLHQEFIDRLEAAPSNVFKNGAVSYRKHVMPARVDLVRVGMHYAVSSLFEEHPENLELFNYKAKSEEFERYKAGKQRLSVGQTTVHSKITHSKKHFSFVALYLGQHNIIGNISTEMEQETFNEMKEKIISAFQATELGTVFDLMQAYFGTEKYSLSMLFNDEKRKILRQITEKSLRQVENSFRDIYVNNYQLMTVIHQSDLPVPKAYHNAVEFVVNHDLHQLFQNGSTDMRELQRLADELRTWNLRITDEPSFKLAVSEWLFREIKKIDASEATLQDLLNLNTIMETITELEIFPDLWKSQNLYFSILKGYRNGEWIFASEEWKTTFFRLGELLRVRME
jgi:alpha-amylase/alpha-mannosidase (GH57 family)